MPSTYFFIIGTLLLSLNLVRPFGLAISDWFYFGAMALAMIETMLVDRTNFDSWTHNRFLWMAGLILIGATISTARSLFLGVAIFEIVQQLYVITLFVSLVWIMVKRGNTGVIVKAFILSGVFTAAIAAVDYFGGTNFGPIISGTPYVQWWGRFAGTLGHPNKFGYFLVITTILSIAWLMRIKPERKSLPLRAFWSLLLFVQIFGIYLSGSLTAYLGLSVGILLLMVSSKSMARRTLNILIPASWVGVMIVCLMVISDTKILPESSPLGNSLISKAVDRVQSITGLERLVIINQAFQEIYNNPFVGVGFDQISTSGISFVSRNLKESVHNVLLQIWYTGGFFAFLGWLVIYVTLGWVAIKTLRSGEREAIPLELLGIASAVLAILLMDQFQDAVYEREKWLAFGLLVGYVWEQIRIEESQNRSTIHYLN